MDVTRGEESVSFNSEIEQEERAAKEEKAKHKKKRKKEV